jgi:hypothetical protein
MERRYFSVDVGSVDLYCASAGNIVVHIISSVKRTERREVNC